MNAGRWRSWGRSGAEDMLGTISERVSDMDGRPPALSLGLPNFGGWFGGDWSQLLDLARTAEDAGVDRLIVTDHVLMGRNTDAYVWGRFPTAPDGPWLEPLTCLSAIAGVTGRVRLGAASSSRRWGPHPPPPQ